CAQHGDKHAPLRLASALCAREIFLRTVVILRSHSPLESSEPVKDEREPDMRLASSPILMCLPGNLGSRAVAWDPQLLTAGANDGPQQKSWLHQQEPPTWFTNGSCLPR
ncbi:Hypothetical predicted protein, partial [Marmota monax]